MAPVALSFIPTKAVMAKASILCPSWVFLTGRVGFVEEVLNRRSEPAPVAASLAAGGYSIGLMGRAGDVTRKSEALQSKEI